MAKSSIKTKESAKLSNNKIKKGVVKDTSKVMYGRSKKRQSSKRSSRKGDC